MSILTYFRPDPSQTQFVLKYRRSGALIVVFAAVSLGLWFSLFIMSLSNPVAPEALKMFIADRPCHSKEVRRVLGMYGPGRVVTRMDLSTISSNCLRREREAALINAQKGALDE